MCHQVLKTLMILNNGLMKLKSGNVSLNKIERSNGLQFAFPLMIKDLNSADGVEILTTKLKPLFPKDIINQASCL